MQILQFFVQKLHIKSIKTKLLKTFIQGTYKFFLRYKKEREKEAEMKKEKWKRQTLSPQRKQSD